MIVFRNKKTNKLYSVDYVQNEIDRTIVEYRRDRSLFSEYIDEKFTTLDLFENPLTEEQQEEVKEEFEQWCKDIAEENILSQYEKTEVL